MLENMVLYGDMLPWRQADLLHFLQAGGTSPTEATDLEAP